MGGGVTRNLRFLAVVAASLLCVFGLAGPAAAHNSLTGSDPRDGARIAQAPGTVRLSFLSRLDPARTTVAATGPGDANVLAGPPVVVGSRVTVPVRPGAAGRYVVRYAVGSADGHKVSGEIEFTVTVGTAASAPVPTGSASAVPTAVSGADATAVAERPATATGGAGPAWLWLVGGLAVVGLAVAAPLIRRFRSAGSR